VLPISAGPAAPCRATVEALAVFQIPKRLGGVERRRFGDYRKKAASLDGGGGKSFSAVCSKPGEIYPLPETSAGSRERSAARPRRRRSPPLAFLRRAEIVEGEPRLPLDARKLTGAGEDIRLPATGALLLHVR